MQLTALGDSALVVRVCENYRSDPENALQIILEAQRRLEAAQIPGVIECAPAFESIGVFFDPAAVAKAGAPRDGIFDWLKERIAAALTEPLPAHAWKSDARTIEVPVCYDADFGADLEDVAKRQELSTAEVIHLFNGASYRVHCVGFVPGFPYLSGLPRELATPRRATPRKVVPPGSVAIGGGQAGIYPTASPGGWNLIGRTPLRLFDAERRKPALLAAGDRVEFRAITRAEFDDQLHQ